MLLAVFYLSVSYCPGGILLSVVLSAEGEKFGTVDSLYVFIACHGL